MPFLPFCRPCPSATHRAGHFPPLFRLLALPLSLLLVLSGCGLARGRATAADTLPALCKTVTEGRWYRTDAAEYEEDYLPERLWQALFPGETRPRSFAACLTQTPRRPGEGLVFFCQSSEEEERALALCRDRLSRLRAAFPADPAILAARVQVVNGAVVLWAMDTPLPEAAFR